MLSADAFDRMAPPIWRGPHLHAMSRRGFLKAAGAAGGVAVASRWWWPTVASAAPKEVAPRPIPEGLPASVFGDANNKHFLHILPPFGPQNGQYVEPITITDFKGSVGRCEVTGTGKGTPTKANAEGSYNFDVDMGFMQGVFVGTDGRRHEATYGFV
jgi:hypothetical protein